MARRSMRTVPQKLLCGLFEFFFKYPHLHSRAKRGRRATNCQVDFLQTAKLMCLRRKCGKSSRSLCMKTSEQKSVSPRTKPAPHYCKPPPEENRKGATG